MLVLLYVSEECLEGVKMSMFNQKVWIGILSSIVISLAAISLSTYSITRGIQTTPAVTSTPISLGQKCNWKMAEVVDVQGNLYAYLGWEASYLHLAKWQNGWMELSYYFGHFPQNATLSPYKLRARAKRHLREDDKFSALVSKNRF